MWNCLHSFLQGGGGGGGTLTIKNLLSLKGSSIKEGIHQPVK